MTCFVSDGTQLDRAGWQRLLPDPGCNVRQQRLRVARAAAFHEAARVVEGLGDVTPTYIAALLRYMADKEETP